MIRNDQNGTVLLFTVIILGLASVSAFIILSRASIDAFVDTNQGAMATQVRSQLDGCMNELLIQLQADVNFSANELVTTDATCTLSLTIPEVGVRHADISLDSGTVSRGLHVEMAVDPVVVTEVSEE